MAAIKPIVARWMTLVAVITLCHASRGLAGVLPEERADALFHSYEGGGVKVNGPSILVRKNVGNSTSVYGNYYVDHVSSASIDVITQGSPYKEERKENSVGIDFLSGEIAMNLGYTNSEESDYSANTASFTVSQDVFGDLTTITMGYARGWDTVMKNGQADFSEDTSRNNYRLELSQVLSKSSVAGVTFEAVSDEGYLNNPYRSVRYLDPSSPVGYSYQPEIYPRTHTSGAIAVQARYYLPYRAAVHGEYRRYADSWGIEAYSTQIDYAHPVGPAWIVDLKYRLYRQTAADFYSDLFPSASAQNFLARDKELSAMTDTTVGIGIRYEITPRARHVIDKSSVNLYFDHIRFQYDDYRDTTTGGSVGNEPVYGFSANVLRLFLSIWY